VKAAHDAPGKMGPLCQDAWRGGEDPRTAFTSHLSSGHTAARPDVVKRKAGPGTRLRRPPPYSRDSLDTCGL